MIFLWICKFDNLGVNIFLYHKIHIKQRISHRTFYICHHILHYWDTNIFVNVILQNITINAYIQNVAAAADRTFADFKTFNSRFDHIIS